MDDLFKMLDAVVAEESVDVMSRELMLALYKCGALQVGSLGVMRIICAEA